VTIRVPNVPANLSDEEICRNRALIEEYQVTVVSNRGFIINSLLSYKRRGFSLYFEGWILIDFIG
jgi:hypothetical protein